MTNCPSCGGQLSPGATNCTSCGYDCTATVAPPSAGTLRITKPGKTPANVFVRCGVDRTGSQGNFAAGTTKFIEGIVAEVKPLVASLTCALQTHGDAGPETNEPVIQVTPDTTPDEVIREARAIVFGGGGDAEETHLHGVDVMLQAYAWPQTRPNRCVLVLFTTNDDKPYKPRRSDAEIARDVRDKKILLYVVGTDDAARLKAFTQDAGGSFIRISNDPSQDEIKRLAQAIGASITRTIQSGSTKPMQPAAVPV